MADNTRLHRAEAVVQALRTGEISAARNAVAGMADGATLTSRGVTYSGDDVFDRLAGLWPLMLALRSGDWTYEAQAGGAIIAHGSFGTLGASPDIYDLRMDFDSEDRITSVVETFTVVKAPAASAEIPLPVRRRINNALAEGKPITLAYVNDEGEPEISLRGSIQVYDERQLCAWIRNAGSGFVRSIEAGRTVAMIYRDGGTRTTMVIRGKGRIATDEQERARVFNLSPEVEQRHDLPRSGAAVIFDNLAIRGSAPEGPVNVAN